MTDHEYSQGVCQDGAAILKDGQPMTIEEILAELRGNQQGILDGSRHIADVSKMVHGSLSMMGNFTDEDGTNFAQAMVIEFTSREDFHAAREAGQCRFTVFGGEV